MRSLLRMLFVFFVFVAVLGGGAFVWYVSSTTEFSRTGADGKNPPKATIVAPKAVPVR